MPEYSTIVLSLFVIDNIGVLTVLALRLVLNLGSDLDPVKKFALLDEAIWQSLDPHAICHPIAHLRCDVQIPIRLVNHGAPASGHLRVLDVVELLPFDSLHGDRVIPTDCQDIAQLGLPWIDIFAVLLSVHFNHLFSYATPSFGM